MLTYNNNDHICFAVQQSKDNNRSVGTDLLSALINDYKGEELILLDVNEKQCFKYKTSPTLQAGPEHPGSVPIGSRLILLVCDVTASRGTASERAEGTGYLLAENIRVG